jgi:hypothetical protein
LCGLAQRAEKRLLRQHRQRLAAREILLPSYALLYPLLPRSLALDRFGNLSSNHRLFLPLPMMTKGGRWFRGGVVRLTS